MGSYTRMTRDSRGASALWMEDDDIPREGGYGRVWRTENKHTDLSELCDRMRVSVNVAIDSI